ncbi:formylglycine-generating enzyme family protein [Pendulispora rubella]|uniref:formylglycine-generating enzyme family protein n=1 Tax=Pendulispora rubella TaxID=2741070 RepID=UPI00374E001A
MHRRGLRIFLAVALATAPLSACRSKSTAPESIAASSAAANVDASPSGSSSAPAPSKFLGITKGTCPSDMVFVPSGTFTMGPVAPPPTNPKHLPAHSVTLGAFCIDRTEVTREAFRERCNCGAIPKEDSNQQECDFGTAKNPPAICVTWTQADQFCRRTGKRLPTEEEWEYAARGSDGRVFPWGDQNLSLENDPEHPNLCAGRTGRNRPRPPGFPPPSSDPLFPDGPCSVGTAKDDRSPFGALDMLFNVREWTASNTCSSASPRTSCNGERIARGSTFGDPWMGKTGLLNFRAQLDMDAPDATVGFRCVGDPIVVPQR